MKKQVWGIAALFFGLNAHAQETDNKIEEVVIHTKFLDLSYQNANENLIVITKEDIENSPSVSIDELLQQYVGLDIRRRGANGVQSDISIRGGSFEQSLILINGIRMNDSQTGHNSMNIPVDLSNVERIEVMKGPAARRFGNNAYSGVINIVTKSSDKEHVKLDAQYGDFDTYRVGISSQFGTQKFSNLLQANLSSSAGYRHNTDYKIKNVFYQNRVQVTNGSLEIQAGFQEKAFGANGFYASPKATEQYEETQASVVSARIEKKYQQFSINSNVYWRRGQDMYEYIRNKPEIYRNLHIGNNVGGEVNAAYKSQLGTTGVGVELRKDYLVSNNLGDRERLVTQVFLEHHFSLLNDKLNIAPGISWGDFQEQGSYFYPGLDVGYAINPQHKVYGNIARTHRIPTFTDLYYQSFTEQGNENLQAENAISYEVGYRYLKNNLVAKASVFGRETETAIDWIKSSEGAIWKAENVGNINLKGFEAELSQSFAGFFKSYSLGYTFMDVDSKQEANFSRYIADQFKHQFIAKLENKFFGKFTNQLIYRYQERLNNYSYHLLDEKLSYQMKKLTMFVLINNITNTNYTEAFGVPMPNRWFHVGFSYDIPF